MLLPSLCCHHLCCCCYNPSCCCCLLLLLLPSLLCVAVVVISVVVVAIIYDVVLVLVVLVVVVVIGILLVVSIIILVIFMCSLFFKHFFASPKKKKLQNCHLARTAPLIPANKILQREAKSKKSWQFSSNFMNISQDKYFWRKYSNTQRSTFQPNHFLQSFYCLLALFIYLFTLKSEHWVRR